MSHRMWMAKATGLAPYYGIAFTRRDLKRRIEELGLTSARKLTLVRVRVTEEATHGNRKI